MRRNECVLDDAKKPCIFFFYHCQVVQLSPKLPHVKFMSRLLLDGWQVVIGIETHAQIKSRQKLFSSSLSNGLFNAFDAAFPGTLPKLNPQCVNLALRAALALNCSIQRRSTFDRKHYFYADLPAGYQITQRYSPFASNGSLALTKLQKSVRIQQIQLEQDTAKSTFHRQTNSSHIDLDRAGTGLLEIVTEPDIQSPEEAADYVRTLQAVLRATGVSDGNMEAGSLRCDVNVSINRPGESPGTRCEIKNLNSVRYMVGAIKHEISRQGEILNSSSSASVPQETRGFDPLRWETFKLRSKDDAPDYRYMPDANLGTLFITEDQIQHAREELPALPVETRNRLITVYGPEGVTANDVDILLGLVSEGDIGFDGEAQSDHINVIDYFETLCKGGRKPKVVINWIIHSLQGELSSLDQFVEYPPLEVLGELIDLVEEEAVTRTSGRLLLRHILVNPSSRTTVRDLAEEMQLMSLSSDSKASEASKQQDIHLICYKAIEALPSEVAAIRAGNRNVINKVIGWVIKETRGRADANLIRKFIEELVVKGDEGNSKP
ncbi:glutamyl-tRNA amidotransferase [Mycena floridula]|nr:glutamyl-tRNA amidotransferase [Mycena floridula]